MNDYISREAVINITAETGAWETQNRVRELPAASVQPVKWISVDEALPIYDGLVLAIDKNNTVRLCIYTEFGWLSQYGNPMIAHITHWQPLPEPPKDGDPE